MFFTLSAIGLALLSLPLPIWVFTVAAILLGLSFGAEVDMLACLTSSLLSGLKNFAQIFGAMFSAVMVAMSLSPLVFGAVFDYTGSYKSILALGVPLCVMAIVLVLMLRPYGRARGGPVRTEKSAKGSPGRDLGQPLNLAVKRMRDWRRAGVEQAWWSARAGVWNVLVLERAVW